MTHLYYCTFSSVFDDFTIIWKGKNSNIQIQRIFLSDSKQKSETKTFECFSKAQPNSSSVITIVGANIQRFLKGDEITFDLSVLDFSLCSATQKKVLLAEYEIPRGWVSTYKRIAEHVGITNGARVVGNSLAKNPFPIFIPCHRAIRSNGELGGYQGGLTMKKSLLELEAVKISDDGKVLTGNVYY
ncbi:MAG: methylated-DNA--[protein]-cysteine S-methyltransferase [Candidatus Heimdallarchaeota archaeon]